MKGSIRELGPRKWELRVSLGPDPGRPGKYRQRSTTFTGSKRAAEAALSKLVNEVNEGRYRGTDRSFDELLEKWMVHFKRKWSVTTYARYEELVRIHISPALGHLPLSKLKAQALDALYDELEEEGLAPNTVRKVHNVIRRSLKQAVMWGWLDANPAERSSPPEAKQSEITPPTDEQVATLMATAWARNPDFATYLALAAATGCRRGELVGLRHSDFDPKESTLLIARSVAQVGRVLTVKGTKTERQRRITLDDDTAAVLVVHLERWQSRSVQTVSNPYIFTSSFDGSMHWKPGNVSTNWAHLCRKAGVKGVRLHDLRHYHGTGLLTAGIDVRTVAGRLGHANPAMTLRVYGHFMRAADEKAAKAWGDRARAQERKEA